MRQTTLARFLIAGGPFDSAQHERTVWGVCKGVLANTADAEDAFQATFLGCPYPHHR